MAVDALLAERRLGGPGLARGGLERDAADEAPDLHVLQRSARRHLHPERRLARRLDQPPELAHALGQEPSALERERRPEPVGLEQG